VLREERDGRICTQIYYSFIWLVPLKFWSLGEVCLEFEKWSQDAKIYGLSSSLWDIHDILFKSVTLEKLKCISAWKRRSVRKSTNPDKIRISLETVAVDVKETVRVLVLAPRWGGSLFSLLLAFYYTMSRCRLASKRFHVIPSWYLRTKGKARADFFGRHSWGRKNCVTSTKSVCVGG